MMRISGLRQYLTRIASLHNWPTARGFALFNHPPISEPQAKRLEGKVAIITGAASGIGQTTARLFLAHGAQVVIADVQDEKGTELAEELGENAIFVHCDVTDEEHVSGAIDKAFSLKKRLDIVHCNAGILGPWGPIDELRIQEFDSTHGVNLRGTVLTMKHSARVMKPAKKGSIVCTGSVSTVVGGLGPLAYTSSKSAMIGLVRTAAVELRAHGIRVNMVSPDGVATPMVAETFKALENVTLSPELIEERMKAMSLLAGGKWLNTLDVAQAALFLASDDSGYISGHNLLVDCGNSVTKADHSGMWFTQRPAHK